MVASEGAGPHERETPEGARPRCWRGARHLPRPSGAQTPRKEVMARLARMLAQTNAPMVELENVLPEDGTAGPRQSLREKRAAGR